MKEFIMRQFDKLLLAFFLCFFTLVGLYIFTRFNDDMALIVFATGLVSSFVSSLNTLITGAIQKANANPNNEKKEEL